ncbi:MAG: bifunctional metallophosphatase/5'-nucleotidase [Syntrophales bacterium]|nr:bifunctional metallophosphatase/5'-nucleotidase [Syntrophales bacterium]
MKKITTAVFFSLLVLVQPVVSIGQTSQELVILFTHDLHSYFLPHRTDPTAGNNWRGGYAKIASLIKDYQAKYGENLLIVDAGDFSMGTLFHTAFKQEASELMLMSKMGYDVITLGNHDFDFHPDGLAEALKIVSRNVHRRPAIVASNILFGPPHPKDLKLREMALAYPIKKYVVIQKGNLKIGVFGLLGKDAQDDAPFARPLKFLEPVETAKEVVKILKEREKTDFIVCLSHSGTSPQKSRSEDEWLAQSVPEIDIIISGHTHTVLSQPIIHKKTIIASAGRYGEYLGLVRFSFRQGIPRLTEYVLLPITEKIPDEEKIAAMIKDYKKKINKTFLKPYGLDYDEIVAEINYHMDTLNEAYARQGETGLGNLITDAYRFAIKRAEGERYEPVHLAIQPLGLIRSSFFQGPLTADDIFRVLSLGLGMDGQAGYPLLTTYLSGREIKQLMEIETTISRMKRDAHLQVSGVKMRYNPNRLPFDRVISIEIQEPDGTYRPVIPDRLYRVAMNYYSAQMVDYISRVSHGLLLMKPKDKRGNYVPRIEESIVKVDSPDRSTELKEWIALSLFLKSQPDLNGNGIPDVPLRYQSPEGRIVSMPSWHPIDLIRGTTYITWGAFLIVLTIVSLLAFILWFMWKKRHDLARGVKKT